MGRKLAQGGVGQIVDIGSQRGNSELQEAAQDGVGQILALEASG